MKIYIAAYVAVFALTAATVSCAKPIAKVETIDLNTLAAALTAQQPAPAEPWKHYLSPQWPWNDEICVAEPAEDCITVDAVKRFIRSKRNAN